MHSTPWTSQQRSKGHLVSDRIQSSSTQPKAAVPNKQKQGTSKNQSPEVNRLQKLISYIQNPPPLPKTASDESCFCLAQEHKIAPYAPLCMSCGMILCELNQPYRVCPFKSCGQPLLTAQGRAALIESLNAKVAMTILEEENMRRKEEEERRRAAGAFPQLGPTNSHPSVPAAKSSPAAPHKVLSLTGKGAVLTTTRKTVPASPAQPVKADTTVPIHRVPPPPPQELIRGPSNNAVGGWQSLRMERMMYVQPQTEQRKAGGSKKPKKARPIQDAGDSVDQETMEK